MILWLKAGHLIAMVAWFAGLFYIFRLFVYHAENRDSAEITALLKVMARRLYRGIMTPAMLATLGFGLAMLATNPGYLSQTWLQVKLPLIAALIGYHLYVGAVRRRFERDDVFLTPRQCRLRNELPLLVLVPVVFLAVFRPML